MLRTIAATIAAVLALGVAGPASAADASCPDASWPCQVPPPCDASTCPPPVPTVCDAVHPCADATEAGPSVQPTQAKRTLVKVKGVKVRKHQKHHRKHR